MTVNFIIYQITNPCIYYFKNIELNKLNNDKFKAKKAKVDPAVKKRSLLLTKYKTAIKKYGSVDSGKSLPFADLPSALKKKKTNKEK